MRKRIAALAGASLCLFAGATLAQTPSLAVSGLPATPLIGEQFCVDLNFTNTGGATGFGPYVLVNSGPFLSLSSLNFVDVAASIEQIGTFDASGVLTNPITGLPINGEPDGAAWIARYPVGSVDPGSPALLKTACAVAEVGAVPEVPINISLSPGFEFGDTSTGTNGPIEEAPQASTVTPVVARVQKDNTAPEGERPPGPSFPYNYTWTVNVSEGEVIQNLLVEDLLPNEVQWNGNPITINAPTGNGCALSSPPNSAPTPGGLVSVECTSLLGTNGASELVVTVPVYITDVLDQGTNATENIQNTVDFAYDNRGNNYQNSDTSNVVAKHAAIQKSVSGTVRPGAELTYSINFQVTDYSGIAPGLTDLRLVDTLPDGLTFQGTVSLLVGGVSTPITPVVVGPDPGSGETVVQWDVLDAVGGTLAGGTRGTLVYAARVRSNYQDGSPVQASDPLTNAADGFYALQEGANDSDGTDAPASILPNETRKLIIAPSPVPDFLMPGQQVVFRLEMDIPVGSTSDILFTDVLPRPVFDVADFDEINDWSVPAVSGATPVSVTRDVGGNSITIDWGSVSTFLPEKLAIDLTLTVSDETFADRLFLTNLFFSEYTNSLGEVVSNLNAIGISVGAPELEITKGVIAADNPRAEFTPPVPPNPTLEKADSDVARVDGGDLITYLITVENVGTQPAFEVTITDPPVAGSNCAAPAAADVVDGTGAQIPFTGDLSTGLVLTPGLPGNDDLPVGGGVPLSDDTAFVTVRCTLSSAVVFGDTLENTASVTWKATPTSPDTFPAQEDSASASIDVPEVVKSVLSVRPGYGAGARQVHIGEVAAYEMRVRIPEGTSPDTQLLDRLDRGLAFSFSDPATALTISADSGVTSSEGSFADIAANNVGFFTVGNAPEGELREFVIGPGRNAFGLGDLVNSNSSNGSDEFVTVAYEVRVLNSGGNNKGKKLSNNATFSWQPPSGSRRETTDRAPALEIIEAVMKVNKKFNPNTGDDTTVPTVTLTIEHNANSTNADAFDVVFTDVLPQPMKILGDAVSVSCTGTTPIAPVPLVTDAGLSDILEIDWDIFPRNAVCTVTFDVEWSQSLNAGAVLENCADVRWESLLDSDQPIPPDPPANSLGFERTGFTSDPGGDANDYIKGDCDNFKVRDVGIQKIVIDTSEPQTDGLPVPAETEPLTIGERATFEITTVLPESGVIDLTIKDIAPSTAVVMDIESADIVAVGSEIIITGPLPTAAIVDLNGDGFNDQASFVFSPGTIDHNVDGITDANDAIVVEVLAKVKDVAANSQGDFGTNAGQAIYDTIPDGAPPDTGETLVTDEWNVLIVEPTLDLTKTGTTSSVEAGDPIDYTLRLEHLSSSLSDANDVVITDTLPPEVAFIPGSLVVGTPCTVPPDSLSEAGGVITASWASFPLGAVCEIDFSVLTNVTAPVGSKILNTAEVVWTSLSTTGDEDDRGYSTDSSWSVVVSPENITKTLVATSVDETFFRLEDANDNLTIGEEATFLLALDLPDGTAEHLVLRDVLPSADVSMGFVSSRILAIGSDLTIGSGLAVGAPGGACPTPDPNCIAWDFGDVVNQIDTRPEPDIEDRIVVEVVAIVNDDPANSGAPGVDKDEENTAQADTLFNRVIDIAAFDLIEPVLRLDKAVAGDQKTTQGRAGEAETFTLLIRHAAISTAVALDVEVTDTLNPDMLWQGDVEGVNWSSNCPGISLVSSPGAGSSGTVSFGFPALELTESCIISYDIVMSNTVVSPGLYPNDAQLRWESAPGSPESRVGTDDSRASVLLINQGETTKRISATSDDNTGAAQFRPTVIDGTIGELVEFTVTTVLDEGTTEDVVVVDTLDTPGWTPLFADIVFMGAQLTAEFPGLPQISGNTITSTFGDIVNTANGVDDKEDTIVTLIVAQVSDVGGNVQGNALANTVEETFTGQIGPIADTEEIDVLEPLLALDKAFTDLSDRVATIQLDLENTGSGPAYDIQIVDEFDEQFWVAGSLVPLAVPPGYLLVEGTDGTTITVTLAPDGFTRPEPLLLPGESLSVSFTMTLESGDLGVAQIPNTATATAISNNIRNPDSREVSDTGDDTLLFPLYDLSKTWSGANNPARPGDVITYTIELPNTGAAPATDIVVTDTPDAIGTFLPGSVTTSLGTVVLGNGPNDTQLEVSVPSLPDGETLVITYNVQLPLPYPDGMSVPEELINQAEADAKELLPIVSDDPATGDVDDPTVVPVIADPAMVIDKDDQVTLTTPGALLSYALRVDNTGDQDATGVVVGDIVPEYTRFVAAASTPGWDCPNGSRFPVQCNLVLGDLAGLSGVDIVFTVQVDASVPSGVDELLNDAAVTDDGIEFDPSAPVIPSTDNDTETTPLDAAPILELDKDDGGISVVPGQTYAYTLSYINAGNQDANGVVLTETVPDNTVFSAGGSAPTLWNCSGIVPGSTCTLDVGTVAAGVPGSATFGLTVDFPAPAALDNIFNSASIADDGLDGGLSDDAADFTPLIAAPDLVVEKLTESRVVREGDEIVYTIDYSNVGTQDATGVVLEETVPVGSLYLAEQSDARWSCADQAPAGTACLITVGALAVGEGGQVAFALVADKVTEDRLLSNTVSVADDGSNGNDLNPEDNQSTAIVSFPPLVIPTLGQRQLLLLGLFVLVAGAWQRQRIRRHRHR